MIWIVLTILVMILLEVIAVAVVEETKR